jgi:hypothetical protein
LPSCVGTTDTKAADEVNEAFSSEPNTPLFVRTTSCAALNPRPSSTVNTNDDGGPTRIVGGNCVLNVSIESPMASTTSPGIGIESLKMPNGEMIRVTLKLGLEPETSMTVVHFHRPRAVSC